MEVDTTATLFSLVEWLRINQKRVIAGAVVVLVVAGVIGFTVWSKNANDTAASEALVDVPSLTIAPGLAAQNSSDAFLKIANQYPDTPSGAEAEILAAKDLFLAGKYAEAGQWFSKFVNDHPGNPLLPQAQVGIAASLEGEGKISDAISKYKEVAARYSSSQNIVNPVKLTLGRLSESQGRPDQALVYYEDLGRNPNDRDPWVVEARERYRLLIAKHPELDKSAAQAQTAPTSSLLNPSEGEMQMSAPTDSSGAKQATPPAKPANPDSLLFPGATNPPPGRK